MPDRAEDIRARLRDADPPDATAAERRAWRTVAAAFEERRAAAPRRSTGRRRRMALAVATLVVLAALAASPVGATVGRWLGEAFDPGRDDARPALVRLPAPGRVLVDSARGPWIVQRDGSKRLLGAYGDADWSPRGLYVAVARGRQLVAVEPDGDPRWALARPRPVSSPAWSPGDGYRVAYLSGRELRVVGGDGTGDHRLARRVADVRPAWRPAAGGDRLLAYIDGTGRVVVAAADGGRRRWRSEPGRRTTALAWTPAGDMLLAGGPHELRAYSPAGRQLGAVAAPPGARIAAFAPHPAGGRAALVLRYPNARRSEVVSASLPDGATRRRLAAGDGRFSGLAWSPDGRWLLIGWPDADQWLFVRAAARPQIRATANISRQFAPGSDRRTPFPVLRGWCCAR